MSILGGILSGIVGTPKKLALPATPEYYTDPNFSGAQDFLKKYSEDILMGKIPDYYKAIGDPASASLLGDYVSDATRDIYNADLESGALTGRGRTGISSGALEKAGALSGTLRFNDYLRAMQGREDLLGLGYAGETGVRQAGFENMGAKNQFGQWKYNSDVNSQLMTNASANARRAYQGNMIKGIDSDLTSAIMAGVGGGIPGISSIGSLGANTAAFGGGAKAYNPPPTSFLPVGIQESTGIGGITSKSGSGGFDWKKALMALLSSGGN